MIPLSDDNPTVRIPVMTILLLAGIASAWVILQGAGFDVEILAMSVCNLGMVPAELTGAAPLGTSVPLTRTLLCVVDAEPLNWISPLSSMFLHGSWAHLLGNMLFLWIFGNNIEDRLGRLPYLAFYLLGGVVAALTQVWIDPTSSVPLIGASGAIAATLGAYIVLYPRARILTLVFLVFFYQLLEVPALLVLGYWFLLQLVDGVASLGATTAQGGVAFFAHIGGFVAGALVGAFVRLISRGSARTVRTPGWR